MSERQSRMQLLRAGPARGARYQGTICRVNPEHGGERYVSTGGCVRCTVAASAARRAREAAQRAG